MNLPIVSLFVFQLLIGSMANSAELRSCTQLLSSPKTSPLIEAILPYDHPFFVIREMRQSFEADQTMLLYENRNFTLNEILQKDAQKRERYISVLRELSRDPLATNKLIEAFEIVQDILAKQNFPWQQQTETLMNLKFDEIRQLYPGTIAHYIKDSLSNTLVGVKGAFAELEVASLVPNLTQMQVLTEEVIPHHVLENIKKTEGKNSWKKSINYYTRLELDLVFDGGRAWGEVKAMRRLSSKNKGEILARAKSLAKWLSILQEQGLEIEMHYFFVNTKKVGMLSGQLLDLGFHVHEI